LGTTVVLVIFAKLAEHKCDSSVNMHIIKHIIAINSYRKWSLRGENILSR